jgi:hypothetical protein
MLVELRVIDNIDQIIKHKIIELVNGASSGLLQYLESKVKDQL